MKADMYVPDINVELVERCIKSLKLNKAAGLDGISGEYIVHSHPSVVIHLKLLFSMILCHCYVPDGFGKGIIVPIIKDSHGDLGSTENYRPITLSPVISKICENLLLELYSPFLASDDLQFVLKRILGVLMQFLSLDK